MQMGVLGEEPVMQRVGVAAAMRLDAERAARHRQHEMPVDFGRGMRGEDRAVLLREIGDAQRLGKTAGAGEKFPTLAKRRKSLWIQGIIDWTKEPRPPQI